MGKGQPTERGEWLAAERLAGIHELIADLEAELEAVAVLERHHGTRLTKTRAEIGERLTALRAALIEEERQEKRAAYVPPGDLAETARKILNHTRGAGEFRS